MLPGMSTRISSEDTKKAFKEKEVSWEQAFLAMSDDGVPIIWGIDARVMKDLKLKLNLKQTIL